MQRAKLLFYTVVFIMISACLHSFYIEYYATQLKQPDGTEIGAFTSGDEYFRRFHDKDGFTMIPERDTGLICWARQGEDGLLQSTGYPVHQYTPQSLGIIPNVNISPEKYREIKEWIELLKSQRNSKK